MICGAHPQLRTGMHQILVYNMQERKKERKKERNEIKKYKH
jgi:hypothetical protein